MYRRRALFIGAGLLASAIALAPAGASKLRQGTLAHPNSVNPIKTFTTASNGGTKVVITNHGNLLGYQSPTTSKKFEHVRVGDLSEGYILCYGTTDAFDIAQAEGGFKPSNVISFPSANEIKFVRNTSDNAMQLTTEMTFDPNDGSLTIKHTVTNNSGVPQDNVVLRRQVDFDTNKTDPDFWARTSDSVMAWDDPGVQEQYGMVLRDLGLSSPGVVRTAKVTDDILDSTCNPDSLPTPLKHREDHGGTIQYDIGTLGAGNSATASVLYERL